MADERLTVGQEVRVFEGGPRGQQYPGEVLKVGRVLVTISWNGWSAQFRIDTGMINERNPAGYATYFLTVTEVALAERERAARRVLCEHRVSLDPGCSLSLEQVEAIAAIVTGEEG